METRQLRDSDVISVETIDDFKYSNLSELAGNGPLASQSQRGIFRLFTFLRHLTSDIIINEIVHTKSIILICDIIHQKDLHLLVNGKSLSHAAFCKSFFDDLILQCFWFDLF